MTKKPPGEITPGSYFGRRFWNVARSSGQRCERGLLKEGTAPLLHQWAANVALNPLGPEQIPSSPSMAACSDRRGIAWEYEPERFDSWTPDFRPVIGGVEIYAEVEPVSEFPMDAAQRALGAGCDADALILGEGSRHASRYRDGGW